MQWSACVTHTKGDVHSPWKSWRSVTNTKEPVSCAKGRVARFSWVHCKSLLVGTDGGAGAAIDDNGRHTWFAGVWAAALTGGTCGDLCWQRERVAAAPSQHALDSSVLRCCNGPSYMGRKGRDAAEARRPLLGHRFSVRVEALLPGLNRTPLER